MQDSAQIRLEQKFQKQPIRYITVKHDEVISRSCISGRQELNYKNNAIQTSKYTCITFLPKNLAEQFSKIANLYFLILAVFQTIPQISISDGLPSILFPLTFIVILTGAKDFYEDYKRKKSDQVENNKQTWKFNADTNQFVQCQWQQLMVGDIIRINKQEQFPADVLVLGTSEPKGICYIETKNLDGETNLKQKNAPKEIQDIYNMATYITEDSIPKFKNEIFSLEFEGPNVYLYQFQGTAYLSSSIGLELKRREELLNQAHHLVIQNKQISELLLDELNRLKGVIQKETSPKISLNNSYFILRGSSLQNTKYVYGLVTYTGHETKVMKNQFKARAKHSQLEKQMGKQILTIFLVQMIICCLASILYTIWYDQKDEELLYLEINKKETVDHSIAYNLFVRLGNWMLMFGNFVPISLLVSLEMVKFMQAGLIQIDDDYMTSYANNIVTPCTVQSSNLNEELGQIQYIFSDKTGTLTCNLMEFKKICINGITYGEKTEDDPNYLKDITLFQKVTNVDFRDGNIIKILENPLHPERSFVINNLLSLSICHTVITEYKDGQLLYNASSPDELALLNFVRFIGFEYQGIDENNIITVSAMGELLKYKLFHTLEFDSTRKRNSVIIQDLKTQQIKLITKGADSIIFDRKDVKKNDQEKMDQYMNCLSEYGKIGLRTLLLAEKEINKIDFEAWEHSYKNASTLMEGRELEMNKLQDEIETNLIIIGATAIEDKLQDEVGETIQALRQAGIKVWVLTGDKVETAINIGYSCQLLSPEMRLIIIDQRDEEQILEKLQDKKIFEPYYRNGYGLVMTGDALTLIFKQKNSELQRLMMEVAEKCESVVCCRVSPAQKQQVVSIVRQNKPQVSTLAIGDGANDVSMITAAHVGIGIKGVEGQQASRASDYSVGEFKMLRSLLFIHGRESYRRNSKLVLYNFFKNIILVFPQFWISSYNYFSGQTIYDTIIYQIYNVTYTSLPIIIFAVFDDEYTKKQLFQNSNNLYQIGPNKLLFSTQIFWGWFTNAVLQSIILTYFCIYSLLETHVYKDGYTFDLWFLGTTIFGLAVTITNFKILLFTNTYNIFYVISLVGGPLTYLFTLLIVMTSPSSHLWNIVQIQFMTPYFHFTNILILGSTQFFEYGFQKLFLSNNAKMIQDNIESYNHKVHQSPRIQIGFLDQEKTTLKQETPPI